MLILKYPQYKAPQEKEISRNRDEERDQPISGWSNVLGSQQMAERRGCYSPRNTKTRGRTRKNEGGGGS